MIEIGQAPSLLLTFAPLILMIFSGYASGSIISKLRRSTTRGFLNDLIYGNVVLCFLFLAGFIIFAVLSFRANEYFTVFTYSTLGLSIFGVYLTIKKVIMYITKHGRNDSAIKITKIKSWSVFFSESRNVPYIFFGVALLVTLLTYHAIIVYYHPIYSEYDSLYLFLPISKSILLGNGLHHDFYLGSDVNMKYPPFTQAMNSWLIHSFEYSSVRLFPVYYLFLAAMFVYSFAKNIVTKSSNIKDSSFLALLASNAFLITPALLVVSSRFSLQQDLPFIFVLAASFYFLSDIVRHEKAARSSFLMLSTTLALMASTREIGIVLSIAIFFLVPAIKFTNKNLNLRATFTVLSFLPLHLYYFLFYGYAEIISGILLLVSNIAVFLIVSQLKNQNYFSSLIRPISNLFYIAPLVVPLIFILTNVIMINGVYPGIVFSDKYYELIDVNVGIFARQSDKYQDIYDMVKGIPRIDVLFISVAMGSVIIFFKIIGFGRLIRHLKNNYEYSLLLILIIFLLATWSFLLQSGFEISNIRHVLYFTPLLSVILIIGIRTGEQSTSYGKLYYYGIIIFMSIYFLEYALVFSNSNNFVGFFIDPFKSPIITVFDLIIGALLVFPLVIHKIILYYLTESKQKVYRSIPNVFFIAIFSLLILILIYELATNAETWISLQAKQNISPPGWENNVFEVIEYLNNAEQGNVLSVRAPAIPFFTNRTTFDIFNFQAFAYNISEVLSTNNPKALKNNLLNMGIHYIVLPNEKNNLYYAVLNLTKKYPILELIDSDKDFTKINLPHFYVYKYIPVPVGSIDLINANYTWKSFGQTTIVQNVHDLIIAVGTDKAEKIFNRGFMQTQLRLAEKPLQLSLDYNVETKIGNASYAIEIKDPSSNAIIFNHVLNNTEGNLTSQTFLLPKNIVNKPLEFRIYVITDGPGQHALSVRKVSITYT